MVQNLFFPFCHMAIPETDRQLEVSINEWHWRIIHLQEFTKH